MSQTSRTLLSHTHMVIEGRRKTQGERERERERATGGPPAAFLLLPLLACLRRRRRGILSVALSPLRLLQLASESQIERERERSLLQSSWLMIMTFGTPSVYVCVSV